MRFGYFRATQGARGLGLVPALCPCVRARPGRVPGLRLVHGGTCFTHPGVARRALYGDDHFFPMSVCRGGLGAGARPIPGLAQKN